ncbi:helix-turn-helix domain-containing protein [Methylocapsa aurea]|uniref:helix-turn-helix domain-containing protein n=1 Tax=Methylocapsa aurea TaxID=663610 RepID=UPI00055CCDF3|nr:helix-turn-helix domain-containing protein [Methylocapsa aurea]
MTAEDYGLKNPTYSVGETLKLLSIGRNTLYTLVNKGELRPIRIGHRTIFSAPEIARFLNLRQTGGDAKAV